MIYCPECGTKSPETTSFCESCGYNIQKSDYQIKKNDTVENSETFKPQIIDNANTNSDKIICGSCGKNNESGSKHCGFCGQILSTKESELSTPNEMILCPNCKSNNIRQNKFCGSCGQSMSQSPNVYNPDFTKIQNSGLNNSQSPSYINSSYVPNMQQSVTIDKNKLKSLPNYKDPYTAMLISFIIPGFSSMWIKRYDFGIGFFIAVIVLIQYSGNLGLVLIGLIVYIVQLIVGKTQIDEYNKNLYLSHN